MLSTVSRRVPRLITSRPALQRRAAGGAPHYNEPTGWLFAEKVSVRRIVSSGGKLQDANETFVVDLSHHRLAKSVRGKAGRRCGIGACLAAWDWLWS